MKTIKFEFSGVFVCLAFLMSFIMMLGCVSAAGQDVSVGVDQLVYEPGEDVTITGYVLSSTTHRPVAGQSVTVTILDSEGSTVDSQSVNTNSQGYYTNSPVTINDTGDYSVVAATATGRSESSFTVEGKKKYTLTTGSFTYQPNQTVSVTLTVETLDSNGVVMAGVSSVTVPVKITRKSDGLTVASSDLITNSNGRANLTYTIPISSSSYSDYSVMAGNGLAVALFKVPSFNAKIETVDANGANKALYSTSDSLYIKAVASVATDSGNTIPITSADIKAYVLNSAGTKLATLTQYTESPSGTYTSSNYSLRSFTNGEYTVKVDITKNNLTQSSKAKFKVKSLRVDAIPIFEKDKVKAFMKGGNASIGLYLVDVSTGAEITGNSITSATVTECKDSKWKDCMSEIVSYPTLRDGYEGMAKMMTVRMPNRTGDFYLKVRVNTTSGNGIGEVYLSLQNIVVFGEIKDSFDNWRWEFGSGETVVINAKVFGDNWQPKGNVANVTIEEIMDDEWTDVKSTIINVSGNRHIAQGASINFTAPTDADTYFVKLKVMMSDGDKGYAYEEFKVSKYNMWVDVKNTNDEWRWKFASDETVDFYVNVYDLRGSAVDTSSYKVSLQALYNEMTGKKYADSLNSTDMGIVGSSAKIRLNLESSALDSGFYRAEFKLVDMDGNEEIGNAWFKVSDLDVWVDAKTSPNGNYEWQYSPTDNITYEITVRHFNGTVIPGARVSIEELTLMQDGPSMPVSSSRYTKSNATITNSQGMAYLWIKPVSGMTLPQGNQMALIKVNASGIVENAEGWFDIRVIKTTAQLERNAGIWSFAKSENVSILVTAQKLADDTNINATASIVTLRDTNTWSDVDSSLYSAPTVSISSSTGSGKITFPAANLPDGQYEAELRVSATNFAATAQQFIWFEVKSFDISGSFTTVKSSYAPGETVSMRVTVKYPNGSAYSGAGLRIYQFAETESWPWNYVTSVNGNQLATTDSNGVATVTFAAPQTAGRYHPMINITTVQNGESRDPWQLPDFVVRSSQVNVNLYTYNSTTRRGIVSQDKFLPNTTIMANIKTTNPQTGAYASSLGYVKLVKYKNLNTQQETTLNNLKSTNLVGNDNITFRTPTELGEYILYVSVNSSNNILTEKAWFKVDMDVKFYMDRWTYSKSDNVTINIDSRNPDGTASNVAVELKKLKSWTEDRAYVDGEDEYKNVQTISGSGQYVIPISTWDSAKNFQLGEYEAELCVYSVGGTCTDNSRRIYVGFSIQTIKAEGWAWQPTYMAGEDVLLVIRANDNQGMPIDVNTFSANLSRVTLMTTGADVTSDFTLNEDNGLYNTGWETFRSINMTSSGDLASGEYLATVDVTYGSASRPFEIWFRVADFKLTVEAIGLEGDQVWSHKFLTGQNITLSISTGNSNDYNGTIRIMDDKSWTQIGSYDIEIINGNVVHNISVHSSGRYSAIVEVENSMEGFWMDVGSYDVSIDHWASMHEYELGENVIIKFNIMNLDGNPYYGDVNVSAVALRNMWDKSCISGDCNNQGSNYIYTQTITMDGTQKEFSFSPGEIGGGEYDVELLISSDGMDYRDGFGFNIRTSIFDVWPEMTGGTSNFAPGSNATFRAYVAYPNGTPMAGVNVSIEAIEDPTKWEFDERNMMDRIRPYTMSALTDGQGNALLKVGLNDTFTGEMQFVVREDNGNQKRYFNIYVSGYELRLERNWERWRFTQGENYTADLYVYKAGNPVSGVNVYLKSRYPEGMNWDEIIYEQNLGNTDSSGHVAINYELDSSVYSENGQYMIGLDVAGGAAHIEDWFKVQSFIMDDTLYGNNSDYSRDVAPGDEVTVDLYIKDADGNPLGSGVANAKLLYLKNPMDWQTTIPVTPMQDDSGTYLNSSSTDSSGRATLKFYAPNFNGEYIAIINVSSGSSSAMAEVWFRVMPYTVTVEMRCSDGGDECGDKYLKTAGSQVVIRSNAQGDGINNIRVCINEVRNHMTGFTYGEGCREQAGGMLDFGFPAASESGQYEAWVTVEVDTGNGYESASDQRVWFEVIGEGQLQMNVWYNEMGGWPGNNLSAFIELRDPMSWQNIDETEACESISVTTFRSVDTWDVIATENQIVQSWGNRSDCGDWCQEVELSFVTPEGDPGEYEIEIVAVCGENTYTRNNIVQIKAFQASTLMPNKIKANSTIPVWMRVTDYNGTPLNNAEIKIKEIRNTWTGDVAKQIGFNTVPDDLGETMYNLSTPEKAGEYELVMEVTDTSSGLMQKVTKWFRIAGLDVVVSLGGSNEFFTGEVINYTVNVTDAFTHLPVQNAFVNINIWQNLYGMDDKETEPMGTLEGELVVEGEEPEPMFINAQTDFNGIVSGNLSQYDMAPGEYGMGVNVNTDTKGYAFMEEAFIVRNYNVVATLSGGIEYNAGDLIDLQFAVNDSQMNPVGAGYKIETCVEPMMMTDGEATDINCTNTSLVDGVGTGDILLPMEISSGPGVLFFTLYNSTDDEVDWAPYLIVLHSDGAGVNYTFDATGTSDMLTVGKSHMFGVSMNLAIPDIQKSNMVMHLKKTGNAVPMSQMMGGGSESNKQDEYGAALFVNSTGYLHMRILSRQEPGIYYAFMPFEPKGTNSMGGKDNMLDVALINYRVI